LNTRSMFKNRDGWPRSWTSPTSDSTPALNAPVLLTRPSAERPVACAPAPSSDAAPASLPSSQRRKIKLRIVTAELVETVRRA
jgi:hypothetical protein